MVLLSYVALANLASTCICTVKPQYQGEYPGTTFTTVGGTNDVLAVGHEQGPLVRHVTQVRGRIRTYLVSVSNVLTDKVSFIDNCSCTVVYSNAEVQCVPNSNLLLQKECSFFFFFSLFYGRWLTCASQQQLSDNSPVLLQQAAPLDSIQTFKRHGLFYYNDISFMQKNSAEVQTRTTKEARAHTRTHASTSATLQTFPYKQTYWG